MCRKQKLNFTYKFLSPLAVKSFELVEKDLLCKENSLNEEQKEILREKRDDILLALEEEIIELQSALSFHCNELVERIQSAFKRYDAHISSVKKAIAEWNSHVNAMKKAIVLQNFELPLKALNLIEVIEERILEFKVVINYYKDQHNAHIIKQTTNILQVIQTTEQIINKKEDFFKEEKKRFLSCISIEEKYLTDHHINVKSLKNSILLKIIKETKEAELKECNDVNKKYLNTPRHQPTLTKSKTNNSSPCSCGCKCFYQSACACNCGSLAKKKNVK